jgi:hypothetical protein
MELTKKFVLVNKREYSRVVNIWPVGRDGKASKRSVKFTTERLVDVKQRQTAAKNVSAEYWAINDAEVDALLSSSAYGITFVRKDDPNGELKKPTRKITPENAKGIALKSMFEQAGLKYDGSLPYSVLKEQYAIHVEASAGVTKVKESGSVPIPSEKVDVQKSISDAVVKAKADFEEKYGYPVPDSVANDLAFFDGLSNPDFNADAYIKNAELPKDDNPEEEIEEGPGDEKSIEEIREEYKAKFGTNVANPKKNDRNWMLSKINE